MLDLKNGFSLLRFKNQAENIRILFVTRAYIYSIEHRLNHAIH